MEDDLLATNRAHWDEVAELHRESYDTASLVGGATRLSGVVEEELPLLGPFLPKGAVAGLDLIHLQCHIGTDTLSWARLGARVTGLDMSAESLRIARELAERAGVEVEFVNSTIAEAATALAGRRFDVVHTSIGALNWLDDLDVWARLVAGLLRPGGVLFLHEGHPMALSLDPDAAEGVLRLKWPYFNSGPIRDDSDIDYSSPQRVRNSTTYDWSHGLGEVLGSLLRAGLTILDFQEHRTLPWAVVPWMERDPHGSFTLPESLRPLCPLAYSLVARLPGS
ncbi:MAG: class I SAM-dependent methyltransferase [Bifidobacteriaceae bacterium]|jgi:SAM-dependent methyltransferase|nr:class I SAM-dependent methyltransferase [Bifidobacteriaceae bacterium]